MAFFRWRPSSQVSRPVTIHSPDTPPLLEAVHTAQGSYPQGSYEWDHRSGKYNLSWRSWQDFELFLADEQVAKCIELAQVDQVKSKTTSFLTRTRFVCARRGTGGNKEYSKKHPERSRKLPPKRTDCPCWLTVKTYPGISTVLGCYYDKHDHDIGSANLRFTRIAAATRDWIAGLLRMGVKSTRILEMAHSSSPTTTSSSTHRNSFIMLADIRRIEKAIEAESIRLHSDDGKSVHKWAQNLQEQASLLDFKSASCPVPVGSGLASDTFTIMIQTPAQREMFEKYGRNIMFIDGTHNVTMYENTILTSLLVRDAWGHGFPIAWMISDSGTETTISYFLRLVRAANPSVVPLRIMTDRDLAQINACEKVYPESWILLCWWHVLHAWQQHFVIKQNEALWEKLKSWVRISDPTVFDTVWTEIQALSPKPFLDYLFTHWHPTRFQKMWSAVYRKSRSILELSDTNMLVEAWHHVLKGKFLEGRRNRRVDHLLHVLVDQVLPYYELKQRRQALGFEGENLEVQTRKAIIERAMAIPKTDIIDDPSQPTTFWVSSLSNRDVFYDIDTTLYHCSCPSFPLIRFCKHLHAVQRFFPTSDIDCNVDIEAGSSYNQTLASEPSPTLESNSSGISPLATPQETDPDALRRRVVERLERYTASLRLNNHSVDDLQHVDTWLDTAFSSDSSTPLGHLPKRMKLSPRLNSWPETQALMMPAKKTRQKRAGDHAYGAGQSSGRKVRKTPKPTTPSCSLSTQPLA